MLQVRVPVMVRNFLFVSFAWYVIILETKWSVLIAFRTYVRYPHITESVAIQMASLKQALLIEAGTETLFFSKLNFSSSIVIKRMKQEY
jgi:hypothetical protein